MITTPNQVSRVGAAIEQLSLLPSRRSPVVSQGRVNLRAELNHFSMLVYEVPAERIAPLIPRQVKLETRLVAGREMAWLSVLSFRDQGPRHSGVGGLGGFEQTIYRVHVIHEGKTAHYLLNLSLGSLSAVATRNLWTMPWHLSAMEFQVSYDRSAGKYREYRLQTQSQWDNAHWELTDSGRGLPVEAIDELCLPSSLLANQTENFFQRQDRTIGRAAIGYGEWAATRGQLKSAQSELLERLGILSRAELQKPVLVLLQQQISSTLSSPTIEGGRKAVALPARLAHHV